MNERVGISVLIPVHNTGEYLRRCLDSVLAQTFKDIEIVCVDDASTDDSPGVLQEYAGMDSRFRVITLEENGGAAFARNVAMDAARGEYWYFMDSDDWIDPDYLEDMHSRAVSTGLDIVINGHWYIEPENGGVPVVASQEPFPEGEPAYYPPVTVQGGFFPVVWCRLYKAEFLKANGVRFPEVRGAEDNYFVFLADILQGKCYVFFGAFYHYLKREGSLSTSDDYDWHHIGVFKDLSLVFRERGIPPKGAKRFKLWRGMRLGLHKEGRYSELRDFFKDVESEVRPAKHYYSYYERAVFNAVLACPDYKTFRRQYFRRVMVSCGYKNMTKSLRGLLEAIRKKQ